MLEELKREREALFDENFNCKVEDTDENADRIVAFCKILTDKTGIQCCTNGGALFECLPAVYRSVVKDAEMQDMR